MDLRQLFDLESHGADTYVGVGPRYPWGGLYGGQIVAQALRAAAFTVDGELEPHSLRAYFIRRGDHTEPIRFEVDRLRNGRSFATRRVVARQAIGAILNLEVSFQRPEPAPQVQTIEPPTGIPSPDDLAGTSWTESFDRRWVPPETLVAPPRTGTGRTAAWMRVTDDLGDDQLLQRCWLAYLSDDLPTDAVARAHPIHAELGEQAWDHLFSASLDHTVWFHRPVRADRWHLHEFTCQHIVGGRGLSVGHVFDESGIHVATVAQEVLMRDRRDHQTDARA
jgi:acyl-CoA thioesterase-2